MTQGASTHVRKIAYAIAIVALLGTSCVSPPSSPGAPALAEFCELWDNVAADPIEDDADGVLVKDQVVGYANDAEVTGNGCTESGAQIELSGATLAEGEEVLSEENDPQSALVAAVTGDDEIEAGEPVLENVTIRALSAEIGAWGITVRGNVDVRLSGVTSTIGFIGTLQNLENWSINLSSSGLTIPGITSTPATFSGTLTVLGGVPTLTLNAGITSARVGDVTVSAANVQFRANPVTGARASVTGTIDVGPSTVSGTVNVDFDNTGALINANADIDVRLRGTQVGGSQIDLTGQVKIRGDADETVVSFTGSGVLGDLVVNSANGSLTLASDKATFVGVIDVAQGPVSVRYNGSIVWDGVSAYTPFLNLEAGGEFSGVLADGQVVSAVGSIDVTVIGSQVYTELTGQFQVGTLSANGTAILETNGATTTLLVDAELLDAGFEAQLEGAIVITDGVAEQVGLQATVPIVSVGDLSVSNATLNVSSAYGSPLEFDFAGSVTVGTEVTAFASVDGAFGPDGNLMSLRGDVTAQMNLDGFIIENVTAELAATPERVTLNAAGRLRSSNGDIQANLSGTFTSSQLQPSWHFSGEGDFRYTAISAENAKIEFSREGLKAIRIGFYASVFGFLPVYLQGDLHLNATGGCDKLHLNGGSWILFPLLSGQLSGPLGCPVTY